MRVISKQILTDYGKKEPAAKEALDAWYAEAVEADWKMPPDVKAEYPKASILKEGRVVFNIRHNSYRLVVRVNYDLGVIQIRFIGTHKEYDRIDAQTI